MISLQIETTDGSVLFDLLDSTRAKAGQSVSIPGGFSLEFEYSEAFKSFGIPEILHFIVHTSIEVEVGLLTAYLIEKTRGKNIKSITLNKRRITEITENGIREVIEEEIKIDQK